MTTIIGHIGRRPKPVEDGLDDGTRSLLEGVLARVLDLQALATGCRRRMRRGLRREATREELHELHRGVEKMPTITGTLVRDLQAMLGLRVDGRQRVLPLGPCGTTPRAA